MMAQWLNRGKFNIKSVLRCQPGAVIANETSVWVTNLVVPVLLQQTATSQGYCPSGNFLNHISTTNELNKQDINN